MSSAVLTNVSPGLGIIHYRIGVQAYDMLHCPTVNDLSKC